MNLVNHCRGIIAPTIDDFPQLIINFDEWRAISPPPRRVDVAIFSLGKFPKNFLTLSLPRDINYIPHDITTDHRQIDVFYVAAAYHQAGYRSVIAGGRGWPSTRGP